MALRRFWVTPAQVSGDRVQIDGDLFHHIRDVCRFDIGDRFEILPGDEKAHLVEVTRVGKKDLEGRIQNTRDIEPLKRPWIHVVLSVPRFPVADAVLEKCVELGVHTVSFAVSEFSFVRKKSELPESRLNRWEKIVKSATQQSGRGTLMQIGPVRTLEETLHAFQSRDGAAGLFPFEGEAALKWKAAVDAVGASSPGEIWLFVGAEGGFSTKEVELFQEFGLKSMTMGAQILRVETACVALVSVIKYQFEV